MFLKKIIYKILIVPVLIILICIFTISFIWFFIFNKDIKKDLIFFKTLHNNEFSKINKLFKNLYKTIFNIFFIKYDGFIIDEYRLFDNNPVPMIIVDSHRVIKKINNKFIELFGYSKEELLGKKTSILTPTFKDFKMYNEIFKRTQEGIQKKEELVYKKKDGTLFWIRLEGKSFNQGDQKSYILWSFLDIDCDVRDKEKLEKIIMIDPLTQLHNRRYLNEIGSDIFNYHKKEKFPLSVLMIDIDYFKKLNDYYGHQKGDYTLKYISKLMIDIFGDNSIICRYGGDEFIIILRNKKIDIVINMAEKLRKVLKNNEDIMITMSIGIAEIKEKDNYIEDTILQADKALYIAKNKGRDQVVVNRSEYYLSNSPST